MKKIYVVLCTLLPTIALAQPDYNFPATVVSPGFEKANQLAIGFNIKPSVTFADGDIFAPPTPVLTIHPAMIMAYSITDHIAITAGAGMMINKIVTHNPMLYEFDSSASYQQYKSRFDGYEAQLGAGYFTNYGRCGILDAYIGVSTGTANKTADDIFVSFNSIQSNGNNFATLNTSYKSSYNAIYLQAGTGIRGKKVILTGGLKYAMKHYSKFQYTDVKANEYLPQASRANNVQNKIYSHLIPYVNLEAGGRMVRLHVQAGVDMPFAHGNMRAEISMGYMTVGMVVKTGT